MRPPPPNGAPPPMTSAGAPPPPRGPPPSRGAIKPINISGIDADHVLGGGVNYSGRPLTMRGYNQDHKPDHPYRLVFTQETQHLLEVHDHEEAKALLEGAKFGVDIAETDPSTGKIWLYVGDRRGG